MTTNNSGYKKELEIQIEKNNAGIKHLRKLIPWGIITCLLFSFLLPPNILSSGKPSDMPYLISAILKFVVFILVYIVSYNLAVKKRKKDIEHLQTQIKILENSEAN